MRSYLNSTLLNALFNESDQEMISPTSYEASRYQTQDSTSPTYTLKWSENLSDKVYLQGYNHYGESKYTFPRPYNLSSNKLYDKGYSYIHNRYSGQYSSSEYNFLIANRDVAYARISEYSENWLFLYVMQFNCDSLKYENSIATNNSPSYLVSPRVTVQYE